MVNQLVRIAKKFNNFDRFYFDIMAKSIKKLTSLTINNHKLFNKSKSNCNVVLKSASSFNYDNYYYDLKHDKFLSSFYNGCCEPTKLKENVVLLFKDYY